MVFYSFLSMFKVADLKYFPSPQRQFSLISILPVYGPTSCFFTYLVIFLKLGVLCNVTGLQIRLSLLPGFVVIVIYSRYCCFLVQ